MLSAVVSLVTVKIFVLKNILYFNIKGGELDCRLSPR